LKLDEPKGPLGIGIDNRSSSGADEGLPDEYRRKINMTE